MSNSPFWFVWNADGRSPSYKHSNAVSAVKEADRLARVNPGETFVVLQSVCSVQVNNLIRTDLRPTDDDMPF